MPENHQADAAPSWRLIFNGHEIGRGTRDAMRSARAVSGDLLVGPNGEIDQSDDWLFPWETADETCYARTMHRKNRSKG